MITGYAYKKQYHLFAGQLALMSRSALLVALVFTACTQLAQVHHDPPLILLPDSCNFAVPMYIPCTALGVMQSVGTLTRARHGAGSSIHCVQGLLVSGCHGQYHQFCLHCGGRVRVLHFPGCLLEVLVGGPVRGPVGGLFTLMEIINHSWLRQ